MRRYTGIFPAGWGMSRRAVVLLLACTMLIGGTTGGTMAWLMGNSSPVHNVFTPSRIVISVEETPTDDEDEDPNTNAYQMMPGATIFKDPVVTFHEGGEDAWLFVKMEKSANFDDFMTFDMAEGWTLLDGKTDIYWREVDKSDEAQLFDTIKDNAVQVKAEVTAAMLNTLTAETYPTLSVTAYAVQRESVASAQDAYALIDSENGLSDTQEEI